MINNNPLRNLVYFVLVSLLASCAILALGFYSSSVVSDGLFRAWRPSGAKNVLWFLGALALAIVILDRLSLQRKGLVIGAALWLILLYGIGAVAAVALFLAACVAIGDVFTRNLADTEHGPLVRTLVNFPLGMVIVMAVVGLLAHFPVNNRITYVIMMSAPVILHFSPVKNMISEVSVFFKGPRIPASQYYAGAVLFAVMALNSVYSAFPEVGHDALVKHLMIPMQVQIQGRWDFDPSAFLFAPLPYGSTWIFSILNVIAGEQAVKLLTFSTTIVIAMLLTNMLMQRAQSSIGYLMSAVCMASPICFTTSQWLFPETFLAVFSLGAFVVLVSKSSCTDTAMVCAFAILAGGCVAVKLHGVLLCVPLIAGMLFLLWKRCTRRQVIARTCLIIVIVATIGGPPYFYSLFATGNPVFPFFNGIFKSPFYPSTNFVDARWIGKITWDLLYQLTFHSDRFGELFDGAFGFQHLVLLPAGFIATLGRGDIGARMALFVSAAYALGVLINTQYIRYVFPIYPLLAIVEVEALILLMRWFGIRMFAFLTAGGLVIGNLVFLATGCYMLGSFEIERLFTPLGRELYVMTHAPIRYANDVINTISGSNARVMYIGPSFGAGLHGKPIYVQWYNPSLNSALSAIQTPGQFEQILASQKVTHVISVCCHGHEKLERITKDVLAREWKLIFHLRGVELYERPRSYPRQ